MPDAHELNLDSIIGKEKQPELSRLDPEFYDKVARLISELEAEKKRDTDEEITNRLELAKRQVMEIIQERMRKIIRIATVQAVMRDKGDAPALTQEEKKLYNALLDLITGWRRGLDQVFGKRPGKKEKPEKKEPEKEIHVRKINNFKKYIMVRLLTTVPTFVGFDDRNYTLAKEDVAMLPDVNAKALIARKAAVQIGH